MRSKADEYEKIIENLFILINKHIFCEGENAIDFITKVETIKDLYEYKKAKKD